MHSLQLMRIVELYRYHHCCCLHIYIYDVEDISCLTLVELKSLAAVVVRSLIRAYEFACVSVLVQSFLYINCALR